jgi:hypothetical protein
MVVGGWALVGSSQVPLPAQPQLPLEPLGVTNEAIFAAFEGWGPHKDGQIVLLLGYFNRNKEQEMDIPIGPNNRIEPGGPDYGQPTHFYTGRQYGVFAIAVPRDFGTKKLTWTIIANGQTSAVTFWTNPPYFIDFFKNTANGNEPPIIKFAASGPTMTGPPQGIAQTLTAEVAQPVKLTLWASDQPSTINTPDPQQDAGRGAAGRGRGADDAGRGAGNPGSTDASVAIVGGQVIRRGGGGRGRGSDGPPGDIIVNWKQHRAPAGAVVKFDPDRIPLQTKKDAKLVVEATTNASFSMPGEYIVRAQVNDQSGDGGGGDQCCWTTGLVKVTVKAPSTR